MIRAIGSYRLINFELIPKRCDFFTRSDHRPAYLGHVADGGAGHVGPRGAGHAAEHPHLPRREAVLADDSLEDRGLAAATGAQESIAAAEKEPLAAGEAYRTGRHTAKQTLFSARQRLDYSSWVTSRHTLFTCDTNLHSKLSYMTCLGDPSAARVMRAFYREFPGVIAPSLVTFILLFLVSMIFITPHLKNCEARTFLT